MVEDAVGAVSRDQRHAQALQEAEVGLPFTGYLPNFFASATVSGDVAAML